MVTEPTRKIFVQREVYINWTTVPYNNVKNDTYSDTEWKEGNPSSPAASPAYTSVYVEILSLPAPFLRFNFPLIPSFKSYIYLV